MKEDKAESYRALYRVRPLIYHIGDIRLWVPIRQDGIVLWLVYVLVFFVFCYVFPILSWVLPLDPMVVMLIGPILVAYYSVKLDPAGKTVPQFLRDLLQFFGRAKWMIAWQNVRFSEKKVRLRWQVWCKPYTFQVLSRDLQEWRGNRNCLGGVRSLVSMSLPAHVRVVWKGRRERLVISPVKEKKSSSVMFPALVEREKRCNLKWTTFHAMEVHVSLLQEKRQWRFQIPSAKESGGDPL